MTKNHTIAFKNVKKKKKLYVNCKCISIESEPLKRESQAVESIRFIINKRKKEKNIVLY